MANPREFKCISVFLSVCIFLVLGGSWTVAAQSDSYVLEAEQHWDTYNGLGGTCISGGHNLAVADVDGDGVTEMVTGGSSYYYTQYISNVTRYAPLKIWNWNGENITLEQSKNWTGNINRVCAGDVDGDEKTEIITVGRTTNETGTHSSLRIWSWDGTTLLLRGGYEGTNSISGITVGTALDGEPEIITIGNSLSGNESNMQICIWQFDGNNLSPIRSVVNYGEDSCANSGCAYDLNKDGTTEIVTAGYYHDLTNSSGQLSVWHSDGQTLSLEGFDEWRMSDGYALNSAGGVQGNTLVKQVKVADVDGDGVAEIVACGFAYDGIKVEGQLRIWNWSGGILNLEKSEEWKNLDITAATSMSIDDVDKDGKLEIVTSGYTVGYDSFEVNAEDKSRAELRVWAWNGDTLMLKQSKDWIIGEGVSAWNVGTGDVDNDGVIEMVTVGCMQTIDLRDCDPDLRIWSILSVPSEDSPYSVIALVGTTGLAVGVVGTTFLLIRRNRKRQ